METSTVLIPKYFKTKRPVNSLESDTERIFSFQIDLLEISTVFNVILILPFLNNYAGFHVESIFQFRLTQTIANTPNGVPPMETNVPRMQEYYYVTNTCNRNP